MSKNNTKESVRYGEAPYQHIQAELKKRIIRGHWAKGALFPSRRALADEFRVSVPTIQKAISDMVAEGILRVEAKRTFVFGDPDKPRSEQPEPGRPGLDEGAFQGSSEKLSLNRTVGLIGYLKPAETRLIRNVRHVVMLDEAGQALARYGFSTRFFNHYSSAGNPEALIASILAERPAAVIAIAGDFYGEPSEVLMRPILDAGIPIVLLAFTLPPLMKSPNASGATAIIAHDVVDEGYQVARHLIAKGCRRLLFFSPYRVDWVPLRLEGALDACNAAGLPKDSVEVLIGQEDINDCIAKYPFPDEHFLASAALAEMRLEEHWDFDGVIAVNDEIACGFRSAAEKAGLKTGKDYLLAGFDDRSITRDLQLTTMHPPLANMGREAARAVAMILEGQDNISVVVLKSRLVERESTRRNFDHAAR